MTTGTVDRSEQRLVLVLLALLTVVLAYSLAVAFGAVATSILHWTGVVLLVAGIGLAAKGISDVRRDWTGQPGIGGSLRQVRTRTTRELWRWRNCLAGQQRMARLLRCRPHAADGTIEGSQTPAAAGTCPDPSRVAAAPPSGGTLEDRVAWLEAQMARTGAALVEPGNRRRSGVGRASAPQAEKQARDMADLGARTSVANLAVGGLRLQTWGVVCLLAGTILTALW